LAVIPARYASSRLPGKPLADIAGQPMIVRVWQQAQKIAGIERTIVATDDERIADVVRKAGGEAELTRGDHPSGSDRVWEVAARHPDFDWILNIQGDEPLINPANVAAIFEKAWNNPGWDVMTLACPLTDPQDFHNPNIVKAAMADNGRVFYCSRAPIPFERGKQPTPSDASVEGAYRHIGLYLFKRHALEHFTQSPASRLEKLEQLEQLRLLELGFSLHAAVVSEALPGVDTADDLHRIAG